jgi:hypothetical protein
LRIRRNRFHLGFHFLSGLGAAFAFLFQGAEHDFIHARVHRGLFRGRGEPAEGQLAGEHFIENHAELVDVGAVVHVLRVFELFGRHVLRRAEGIAGLGERG